MSRLIQGKRATVAAVTDGRKIDSDGLVDAVIRELRDGRPFTHLRAVMGGRVKAADTGAGVCSRRPAPIPTRTPNVHPDCINVPGRSSEGFEELCHLVTEEDPTPRCAAST